MNEIMTLISSMGTTQVMGIGGMIVAIVGYASLKTIKQRTRKKHKKSRAKNFELKSTITNDAYDQKNKNSYDSDFSPDTYTVNTEDYTAAPKRIVGPILRPRGDVIDSSVINMEEDSIYNSDSKNSEYLGSVPSGVNVIENTDNTHLINKAFDADKSKNNRKALEYIKIAMTQETNNNEKLRLSKIIQKYSLNNDSLVSLFNEYPSIINVTEVSLKSDLEPDNNLTNQENQEIKFEPVIASNFIPDNISNLFNLNDSNVQSTYPSQEEIKKEVTQNFQAEESYNEITDIFASISTLNSTKKDIEMNNNENIAAEFNKLLENMNHKDISNKDDRKDTIFNRLAYDIWVQWMSTANGKTSFKSSMYKLKNPWTSRKAIIELSENLTSESKNLDGTNSSWSVISIHPFFDI